MARNISISSLKVQDKAQKSVDQAGTRIKRATSLLNDMMLKNDPPSKSTVDKAEKFV